MPFKKTIDFKKLEKKINDKVNKNLALLGNEVIADLIHRTQSGKDVNNRTFKGYTAAYKKSKKKSHGSKVNLTASGNMLNNITWKKIKNGIRIYFSSKQERDKAHGNQRKRKFFGLDRRQKKRIAKKLNKL